MQTSQGNRAQGSSQSFSMPRAQTQLSHARTQNPNFPNPNQQSKNSNTIAFSEILRIQQKCFGQDENSKFKEKLELYEKSKERVKKWPNTLNAIRKKKDQSRFERFKVDEEERRKIEQEEAIYQAEQKRIVLEKANQQIYENNDRVRAFQSKILLTDIHQEREGQMELKQHMKEIERLREDAHFQELLEQKRKAELAELRKQEELQKKKKEQHRVLREQHEEMKNKYIRAVQEEKIDGELLKLKVQELFEQEDAAAQLRKAKLLQNQEEIKKGNEILKDLKHQEKMKEIQSDKKIEEHARKKEQIMEMRKRREELKFKEKQAERQKLIDKQIAFLKNQLNQREVFINKQIEQAEEKQKLNEKQKQEKLDEMRRKMNEQRQLAIELRKLEKERDKVSNKDFQIYWKQRNLELQDQEEQERNEIRARNNQLKDFHLQQMDEKMKIREKLVNDEMEEEQNILRRMENDNKTFNSWAERCVKEWTDNGKNVGPMIKELKTFKQN